MNGFKFIKTTYKDQKEIVRVNFNGDPYNSFVAEVKKTYNIPQNADIQILTTDFVLKSDIFGEYVGQYIDNLNFVLDIKVTSPVAIRAQDPVPIRVQETVPVGDQDPILIVPTPDPTVYVKPEYSNDDDDEYEDEGETQDNDFLSISQAFTTSYYNPSVTLQELPGREEIRRIREIQDILMQPRLENKHRTRIAKAIIGYIQNSDPNVKLVREHFLQLAQTIVEIFPSELRETYYVPCVNGRAALGKLFDAYHNARTQLRAAGLIPPRRSLINTDDYCSSPRMLNDSESRDPYSDGRLFVQYLPTPQEICRIRDVQEILKIPKIENKHRTKIAKAIITYIQETDPERKITREEFIQLTKYIVEIFPSELRETYYVPFAKGQLPKGKLYDAYNNNRTRLRAAGVIRRRAKADPDDSSMDNSTLYDGDSGQFTFDESEIEILKYPENSSWDVVETTWTKSHRYRQNELHNAKMNILDYIDKYKVLQNEKCHELIGIDYKMLYPNATDIYNWRNYYYKVMDKTKNMKDSWIKDMFKNIEEADCNDEEDTKLAIALMLVPYIVPNARSRRKQEVQEEFIQHVPTDPFGDEDECQPAVKRLKIENDPKIYFIAGKDKIISHAYADIGGLRMKFQNPLKAVEVCFQCFMTMNLKYPRPCFYVWIFIQQLIFNVKHDAILPNITTLINDLNNE
ncbi:uncharacterized protein LOC142232255 [Haematobia irritans]|uniref:uncharacterized protein LOC142232255 n=1 Tax=Haematobia irritans TaxID=7368 RepID=UPI003F4F408F